MVPACLLQFTPMQNTIHFRYIFAPSEKVDLPRLRQLLCEGNCAMKGKQFTTTGGSGDGFAGYSGITLRLSILNSALFDSGMSTFLTPPPNLK